MIAEFTTWLFTSPYAVVVSILLPLSSYGGATLHERANPTMWFRSQMLVLTPIYAYPTIGSWFYVLTYQVPRLVAVLQGSPAPAFEPTAIRKVVAVVALVGMINFGWYINARLHIRKNRREV